MEYYKKENRKLWDEWTSVNSKSRLYRLDEFKKGVCKLNHLEIQEVGDVVGKSMLHLQCHFGMDSLSWVMRGANVTGVDFSKDAIDLAKTLSREMNLPAQFICSDIYDLPNSLSEKYDIVFTSYGVLTWLDDIQLWAKIVASHIKKGGFFYIAEFHPTAMIFSDQISTVDWQVEYDYFYKEPLEFDVKGSYADKEAIVRQSKSYEWQHTLGDIVTALINAGLRIEFLHEHEFAVYEMFPFLEEGPTGEWKTPDSLKKIPLMFSIKAIKESD